ncbi:Aldo/keto reductase [Periconia macrospinosa]|uniref:Aldo/keto reductase n=1 Tax=Periconia macrospinosa TaxID=97972 RepID=A0A2V1D7M7_9PLEO|nr:Aldo/keto reductase [Periconia macrospinosa]
MSPSMTIILGTMLFGEPGACTVQRTSRNNTPSQAREVLDVFQSYGHKRLDTARTYGEGSCEPLLAAVGWKERGLNVDTKLFPSAGHPLERGTGYTYSATDVRRGLLDSLKALGAERVETFFLHGPDRNYPFEETVEEVNKLLVEGLRRGWPLPSVYEGHYNGLMRRTEDELFPCIRHYGIAFHVYSPLCSGFLTGQYSRGIKVADIPNLHLRALWNPLYFDGLDVLQAAATKNNLTLPELCLRWLVHHSNCGPLSEELVQAVDAAWFACRAGAPKYWY